MENNKDVDRKELFQAVSELLNNELMQENITDYEVVELIKVLTAPLQRSLTEAIKHIQGE